MLLGSKCFGWWWIFLLLPTIKKSHSLSLSWHSLLYFFLSPPNSPIAHLFYPTKSCHLEFLSPWTWSPKFACKPNDENPIKRESPSQFSLLYSFFCFLKCSHITDQHVTFHSLSYSPRVGSERNAPFPCFCKLWWKDSVFVIY